MGEGGESGRTEIGRMQIYRGGLRKNVCLERERERETESKSDAASGTFDRNRESKRWQKRRDSSR